MKAKLAISLGLGLAVSVAALAQSTSGAASDGQALGPSSTALRPALSSVAAAGGIHYICGGVGESEEATIKALAPQHDLMLTFATKRGQYMADVDVKISNASGRNVLSARCDAPIMLVDFPSGGKYRVHASSSGYDVAGQVTVPEHGHRAAVLRWPDIG